MHAEEKLPVVARRVSKASVGESPLPLCALLEFQPGRKWEIVVAGRSVGGFVKNDKVPNLASDHAFALAALLFGNVCEQKKNPWASVVFSPSAVMPALVAGIHVFKACSKERRGWPEQARP